SMRTPRARVAWTTTRAGAGMACIGTLPWSCWPIAFWRASAGYPLTRRAFPPSAERPSFPAVHRQVLLWLFQDVVLWLIATNQIAHFRPIRIYRSSTRIPLKYCPCPPGGGQVGMGGGSLPVLTLQLLT